ncbi:hypothetical protein [Streptomyces sp. ZL-24]|uniref:hypothetical protein n=1 Tax=Streptomyces sp. ZL-24 TaxID=1933029 RepID=UPI001F4EF74E|nr:hypothetical protein [Streptomyces sp. ZL-24]
MTTTIPLPSPPVSSVCPTCQLIFEACRCTGYTDQHHRLVQQLVADGDRRARTAGRQAPRTLQEMAPGLDRQPVLRMVDRPVSFTPTSSKAGAGADDACVLCGWWKCRCGGAAPAPTPSMRAVAA